MPRFNGKVAVITGGASGIGLATARQLAADGARVVLGDRDAAGLAAAVEELGGEDVAAGVTGDVTVEADVESWVEAAIELFGGVHLAVNSAGVGTFAPIADHPVEEWDRVVDICLKGVFLSVKHESKAMQSSGSGGAIVNVASLNGFQAGEGMTAYCTAKAGVVMLTKVAAMELGSHGIRVAAIAPGFVETPLTALASDEMTRSYLHNTPLGRTGQPGDIASAVCWLLSDEASWISGDTLKVDGAAHTREYPRFFDTFGF
jgi:NAD(P)-dependent dehydrogenase (short-subunit alcohol dehydrogenase family)